jgi:hypothetical protein
MPQLKVIDRSSEELQHLFNKVQERLRFHHDCCISLTAIRGAIETELLRRESRLQSGD